MGAQPSIYGPIKEKNGNSVYLMFHIGDGHKSNIYGPPRTGCKITTPTPPSKSNPRQYINIESPVPYPPFVLPKEVTPNLLVSTRIDKVGNRINGKKSWVGPVTILAQHF